MNTNARFTLNTKGEITMQYNSEFYVTTNIYLAYALSFVGFEFYRFDAVEGGKGYSFRRTEQFQKVCDELHKMKKEYYFKEG